MDTRHMMLDTYVVF